MATGAARGTSFGHRAGRAFVRQLNRFARDLALGQAARFRYPLHHVAVTITGGKIHFGVDALGILAQFLLDATYPFDELAPVHRSQKAEAADAVRDRDLVGGLFLSLRLHQLLDRKSTRLNSSHLGISY